MLCLINGKPFNVCLDNLLLIGKRSGLNLKKMITIVTEVEKPIRKWFGYAALAKIPELKAKKDYANFHFTLDNKV